MPSETVLACARSLADRQLTLAFAESATAGRMAAEFSLTPDSGKILKGGLVCYDACVKKEILGLSPALIERYTPESDEVTRELARQLQPFMKADVSVAVTGLTTPGGSEAPGKPVGTIFFAVCMENDLRSWREVFKGSAEEIVLQAIDAAAAHITARLEKS